MTQKTKYIKIRVSDEEKEIMSARAKDNNTTVSDLIRTLIIKLVLPDPDKKETINALLKANADLARLDNTFKLGIDQGTITETEVASLASKMEQLQVKIIKAVEDISGKSLRRRPPAARP